MNFLERKLNLSEDPEDRVLAGLIGERLRKRGKDIPYEEKAQLPLSEKARQTEGYKRLKEKFGAGQYSNGLNSDSLTFGDLWDLVMLYGFLRNNGHEITRSIFDHSFWVLYEVADLVSGNSGNNPRNKDKLHTLKRDDPLFQKPLDLDDLMENPSFLPAGQFELGHNNGIMIHPNWDKEGKFLIQIMTTVAPKLQNPHVVEVLKETGLPVS